MVQWQMQRASGATSGTYKVMALHRYQAFTAGGTLMYASMLDLDTADGI